MSHINLLPWREAQRKQKKQDFFVVVGAFAGVMAIAVLTVHVYMASLIDNQLSRNNILKNEIKLVEKKIEEIKNLERQKEQLIARMRVIEELQSNRPAIVHLLDELAKIIPEGMVVEDLTQKGNKITINGSAQSNARVSAFMRALEDSPWFSKPSLDVINTTSAGSRKSRTFKLNVNQSAPIDPAASTGGKK
ncbi:MAG: PilN domain-containing protein [Pseudomonadota bacterium]